MMQYLRVTVASVIAVAWFAWALVAPAVTFMVLGLVIALAALASLTS